MPDSSQLQYLHQCLFEQFRFRAFWGVECEFYIQPALNDASILHLSQCLSETLTLFEKIERESGVGQLEFALKYTSDIDELLTQCNAAKAIIAQHYNTVSFSPKPFADQPASGLHVHVHLENEQGERIFYKDDATISDALKYSIAGLLEKMPEATRKLWRSEEDILRIQSAATDVPKTLSWGANNRSCAIRLPDKPKHQKHIEYRLAGAHANAEEVIALVLEGMLHGLQSKPLLPPQIYGNAHDPQYSLKSLI